jgi:hypothetical protein
MADVFEAFAHGQLVGSTVTAHQQQLEENKLRAMVLKHHLQALKVDDALRNRDIALQHEQLLEGTPESEIQPEPGVNTAPPEVLGPGVTLPEAPKRLAPVQIPGVSVPEAGINVPGFSRRPRTLEELIQAQSAAKLREVALTPQKTGAGERVTVNGHVIAEGPPKLQSVGAGGLANSETGEVVVPGRGAPPARPMAVRTIENGKPVTKYLPADQVAGQTFASPPPASVQVLNGMGDDVAANVQGIQDGTLPPEIPRSALGVKVKAGLQKAGFDLTKATQDYNAQKKYLGTLNGNQMKRLRDAVTFTRESLGSVRSLAAEWDQAKILKGGKLVPLNDVELKLAASGAYGEKAASVATRLQGQINDVVSELATVYKGGNSSTDEGLKLAASNLKAGWSRKVLLDNLDQVDQNLRYRENAIKLNGAVLTDDVGGGGAKGTPDLSGLQPGHGRTFNSGPFKGQTWTVGADGTPSKVGG